MLEGACRKPSCLPYYVVTVLARAGSEIDQEAGTTKHGNNGTHASSGRSNTGQTNPHSTLSPDILQAKSELNKFATPLPDHGKPCSRQAGITGSRFFPVIFFIACPTLTLGIFCILAAFEHGLAMAALTVRSPINQQQRDECYEGRSHWPMTIAVGYSWIGTLQ